MLNCLVECWFYLRGGSTKYMLRFVEANNIVQDKIKARFEQVVAN